MRAGRAVSCAAAIAVLAGCTGAGGRPDSESQHSTSSAVRSSAGGSPTSSRSAAANQDPLAADSFWVNPDSPAAREISIRSDGGKASDIEQLTKIASQPTAVWLGSWQALKQLPSILSRAAAASSTPVFVAYFIPDRDCGGASAGGAQDGSDYRSWIAALAAALAGHRAVVVLEPDAVPMSSAGGCAVSEFGQRSALLSGAVHTLKANSQVSVYLDAGHPAWPSDPTISVAPLRASGLMAADGFALNTSNFQSTADDLKYGDALAALVGGKHFIVDTGRNGDGPLPEHSGYKGPSWCNPPGRALGPTPTASTGDPLADAFLWIKYPGESDGSCGLGDLAAGSWLPDYAIGLARRSK